MPDAKVRRWGMGSPLRNDLSVMPSARLGRTWDQSCPSIASWWK